MLVVLLIAVLVYMIGTGYIHTEYTTALLQILTGQDHAKWPRQDIARVENNIQRAWEDVDDAPRRLSQRVKPVVKTPVPTLPPQKTSYTPPDLSHTLEGTYEGEYYGGEKL